MGGVGMEPHLGNAPRAGLNVHPSNVELAYHAYEVLHAMSLSALDHTRVELPLPDPASSADLLARTRGVSANVRWKVC